MTKPITVPTLGESVTEAIVARWFKSIGDTVELDEPIVELETDKVTVEVPSPAGGVLSEVLADSGAEVAVGALLGSIQEGAAAAKPAKGAKTAPKPGNGAAAAAAEAAMSPAVRKLVEENRLDPAAIPATGPKGHLTKGDVIAFMESAKAPPAPVPSAAPAPAAPARAPRPAAPSFVAAGELPPRPEDSRGEERVRMSRLRQRIAERLKEAQNTAAMLTTFNEIDMTPLMDLRAEYRDAFEKKHGVKLGFMSFFT